MSETCPYCGDIMPGSCGSWRTGDKVVQTTRCKERAKYQDQISVLTEKLEAWRGLKPDLDLMDLEEGGRNEYFLDHDPIIKLRELGEVE